MKVLELNEKYLKFLGLLSKSDHLTTADRILRYFAIFVPQFAFLYTCHFSAMYIYCNPNDMVGATNAFIMFLSALYSMVSLIGYIVNEESTKQLHLGLQSVVDNGSCIFCSSRQRISYFNLRSIFSIVLAETIRAREIYQNAERKCQKITTVIAFILLRTYPCSILLPTISHGVFCMCVGNLDTSTWYFACSFEGIGNFLQSMTTPELLIYI